MEKSKKMKTNFYNCFQNASILRSPTINYKEMQTLFESLGVPSLTNQGFRMIFALTLPYVPYVARTHPILKLHNISRVFKNMSKY